MPECRPSERDMIQPPTPCPCEEHESVCAVVHSLHQRLVKLEEMVRRHVEEDAK